MDIDFNRLMLFSIIIFKSIIMKKLLYLILILLVSLNCSNDDGSEEPCYFYSIFFSDDCDCTSGDFDCGDIRFISEMEYNRLLEIQQNSTEDCIYIESESNSSEIFEGYIIELNKSICPSLF